MIINTIKDKLLENKFILKNNVFYDSSTNEYTQNFGKQWRDFSKTQIDEFNNTTISKDLLSGVIFNEEENLYNKTILEVGCGSGRFSQYLSNFAKLLVANDMSDAIFFNQYTNKDNVIAIKSDFKKIKELNIKFDIVICRGVLQHTPNPYDSIISLHELCNDGGSIYFDIYKRPKFKLINPKYIWRNILKNTSYETLYVFLNRNIDKFLFLRRKLNKIFLSNLNFFWDYFFPIYDYKYKLPLDEKQLREWAILDTLDGLVTKYDTPLSKKEIEFFLMSKNIQIEKFNEKYHSFKLIK